MLGPKLGSKKRHQWLRPNRNHLCPWSPFQRCVHGRRRRHCDQRQLSVWGKHDYFGGTTPAPGLNGHPFSNNEEAVSSIANNTETGISVGFNIMPDKPIQITFNGMLGANIVSFSEISALEDPRQPSGVRFSDDLYTMFGGNASLEVNLQFKIGGFLKMGAKGGYRLAVINGRTRNGPLLKMPSMFSGPYIGANLVFGSF